MKKKETKRSNIVARILGVIIGIIIILGISYALFQITLNGTKKNKVVAGTLSLKIKEDDVTNPSKYTRVELLNTLPKTDKEGLEEVPYVFTIINDGNIDARYTLKLEVSNDSTLPDEVVKFAYKKDDSTYSQTKLLINSNKEEGKELLGENIVYLYTLDEDTLDAGEERDYTINFWVDHDASNDVMDKEMTAIIRVDGIQKNK